MERIFLLEKWSFDVVIFSKVQSITFKTASETAAVNSSDEKSVFGANNHPSGDLEVEQGAKLAIISQDEWHLIKP